MLKKKSLQKRKVHLIKKDIINLMLIIRTRHETMIIANKKCIGGVTITMLTSSVMHRGFEPQLG